MSSSDRSLFERWAGPQGYRLHIRDMQGSSRFGQYCEDISQAAWEAWQAASTVSVQVRAPDECLDTATGRDLDAMAGRLLRSGESDAGFRLALVKSMLLAAPSVTEREGER